MQKIGIVSVTINAAAPLTGRFAATAAGEGWVLRNYLDEGLQELVGREGGVTPRSIARLTRLIGTALDDGATALLLTCTVFTPYGEMLQSLFAVPVLGADSAMLEQAAATGRKTAILCTFPAAVETSARMFRQAVIRAGSAGEAETLLLPEAATAMQRGDRAAHDRLIAEKAASLASSYGQIVLAQMSMAGAAELLVDCPVPVLTSPGCAVVALKDVFAAGAA